MKTSLNYSQRALDIAPEQVHFQFNVAFVQIQIAQLVYSLNDSQRTLAEVQAAADDLDIAIESFSAIAKSPNPPFPKNDIEQRANMGRNTMRKQLERALQSQQKYEELNKDKLQKARELREAEARKREEQKQKELEAAAERKRKLMEERQKLQERDREYMERRAEEERRRQELIDDSEMRKSERRNNPKKGGKRKKKSEMDDSETEGGDSDGAERPRRRRTTVSGTEGLTDEERPRQKKRKLERKNKEPIGKYKSAEVIVDSDSDGEADLPANGQAARNRAGSESGDEGVAAPRPRKTARVISEDEDDEEAGSPKAANGADVPMVDEDDDE
jgi:RNA polymerase-associated protein CTR9